MSTHTENTGGSAVLHSPIVRLVAVLAAVLALVATATASASSEAKTIRVNALEMKFTGVPKTLPKGSVTFVVRNTGALPHDLKIAGKKTALIQPGKSAKVVVSLKKAGKTPFLCTVAGHAAAGMKGTLTVK